MVDLVYRPSALTDLDGIYQAIETDDPRRATKFIEDIRARCRNLSKFPELGPARADLGKGVRIYHMSRRVIVIYVSHHLPSK